MSYQARTAFLPLGGAILCAFVGLLLSVLMHHATLIELDEIGSWGISKGGALEALKTCVLAQGQGPLYFILLSFWMQIFGDSVLALRSLSMVTFAGAIVCLAYAFARIKIKQGLITGALLVFLFSWCSLNYSFIARPYALALFFVACGICISAHPELTRSRRMLLAVVGAATFFTHYFFVLPLILASLLVTAYRVGFDNVGLKGDVDEIRSQERGEQTDAAPQKFNLNASLIKNRILSVVSWELIGVILGALSVAPFFVDHLGSVSDLRYLTLPVPELLIPALQSFPLAPIGLLTPLYLLLKKNWSIYDAYYLGLFELIFSIGLILGLYVASHLLEGTFFVPRYFGIALPILLILVIKVGNQLAEQKAPLVAFVFSFQIFWSLFGPPNLAYPLMSGLLNLNSAHASASDYRAALKTNFNKAHSMSFGNQEPSTAADDIEEGVGNHHQSSDTISINPSAREQSEQYLFSKGYQAQYERNVRAPDKLANCAVFISSGFIESASLDRMHNQLLQPFLRSPAEYFFRGDFELLPKHFFHYNVASEYVNKIRDKVYQKGCALLVPARDQGFSTQLWQSLESIPPSLRGTELIVEPYREWLDSLIVRAPL